MLSAARERSGNVGAARQQRVDLCAYRHAKAGRAGPVPSFEETPVFLQQDGAFKNLSSG